MNPKRTKIKKSKFYLNLQEPKLIAQLKQGGVGVLPTDTLYGLVGSALNKAAVERIYKLKGRDLTKPAIILIASINELDLFGITENDKQRSEAYWPGPTSLIFSCPDDNYQYLHRGKDSLALRLPVNDALKELLTQTGPLIAPSANPQAKPPATTTEEAKVYFGDRVDFYVDGGKLTGKASKLISLLARKPQTLRN